ncbi:Bromodomain-containing protein [Mycena chlorophos]|uniref:Bromodomain-containing protein n=1 Tax=Mycena chlorophos TaxID=658473 RepID=A0A8H6RYP9_MYCCL|nr:Bromodomain-containing protein [Mycena chlorophos]
MARGNAADAPQPPPLLPTVSFQKIENDASTQPSGVSDGQARSFGYNDFSEFNRPDQYIRHIEPLEVDLERQVEYDMDEQDQEWLDAVNAERKKEQMDKVSYEVFEVIMDRLEKEWFNLSKLIPKTDLGLPSEDSTCAICDDAEGENSNAIVFCDGCNLAVHQDCYGVPYIPEGQWLCRKCTVSPDNTVSCLLCPNEGGAFKQTTQGQWVHLLCAIWVPETRVSNDAFMEPIIGVDSISKQRWKLKCSICPSRGGACIQCGKPNCFVAFHVSCARKDKLLLPMKSAQGGEPAMLTAFCERHLPTEHAEAREAALEAEAEAEEADYNNAKLAKSARAYAKTYKPGPPLVPAVILNRIGQYINKVTIRKKPEFLAMLCRYWSLKREARRGAPLLKRLHLEPWTSSTNTKDGEEEKHMKLDQLQHLRKDLEDLRNLTILARRRETRKLKQAEVIHEVISRALFPHLPHLRAAFDKIVAIDRLEYFKHPVRREEVPDYFDVIQNPMAWSNIEAKLDACQYWDLQAFKDDIQLVLDNAILYNKPNTPYHKTALRIQAASQPVLAQLSQLCSSPNLRLTAEEGQEAQPWVSPATGDLEPPLEVLELLLNSEAFQGDSELILSTDPITSLLNLELPQPKPPSEDPEALARAEKKARDKARRDQLKAEKLAKKEAEKQRRAEAKEAAAALLAATKYSNDKDNDDLAHEAALTLASMSAPVAPRVTRGSMAQVAALEAEQAEAAAASVSAPAPRRRHRKQSEAEATEPRQSTRERGSGSRRRAGDDVDDHESFSRFYEGTRRTRQSDSAGPPPKKKARWDEGPSRVTDGGESSRSRSAPHKPRGRRPATDSLDPKDIPAPVIRTEEDGQVVVEEYDSPAIRRAKNKRRNNERRAAEAEAAASGAEKPLSSLSSLSSSISVSRAELLHDAMNGDLTDQDDDDEDEDGVGEADDEDNADADADGDGESDAGDAHSSPLTTEPSERASAPPESVPRESVDGDERMPPAEEGLTPPPDEDVEMEDAAPEQPVAGRSKGREEIQRLRDLGRFKLNGKELVESGTLVWVKSISFPWWPAIVFHDSMPEIPPNVLQDAQRKRQTSKKKGFLHIVRFYDKNKNNYNWEIASPESMRQLAENKELDREMLAKNSRLQQWKKSSTQSVRDRHAECAAAYHEALDEMESGDEKAQFTEIAQNATA